nr:hypothetical protein [Tanacetum cinerariifolium]
MPALTKDHKEKKFNTPYPEKLNTPYSRYEQQLVADTMKALKESKKLSRSQPHARGSSEGTGTKTLVLNGSTVILTLSSEETGTKSWVPDEKDDADDDKSIDLENTNNEETEDEVVHSDEYVNDNVDEEMYDAEDVDIGKVFLMAQQVVLTDQLVSTKYLTAGRCDNYVVLDSERQLARQEEDYHSIKDGIPLVSVYSTGDVIIRGMLIPDAFSTDKIHATDDYAECETVFVKKKKRKKVTGETSSPRKSLKVTIKQKKAKSTPILPPSDDKERDEIVEATLLSLPLHKTGLVAEAQENVAKVQEKLDEDEIENMVEGEGDKESYASDLADSMLNDDDDSYTRIEPGSHKENPKVVNDYDDVNKTEKEDKKDEKKDDDAEKKTNDDVQKKDDAEEKDNNDHTDHALVGSQATSSLENRNEKMQTPIPTPPKYPRINLSLDKTISEELTTTVSPKTATTSKTKQKKGLKVKQLIQSYGNLESKREKEAKRKFDNHSYFIKPVGGSSMWPQPPKEPPLPPVLKKILGRPRKLRIKHVTERVNVITRNGRMMTCQNCWEKDHNKLGCKKEKQPKPTVEKRAPGRKKADSNFVFQTCDKDGGDANPSSAGPSVADPSSAGPSVADPSSACPSVADPSSTGPSVANPSSAGPSVADLTDYHKRPYCSRSTDDIPTQQSKTSDSAKIIEDAIATERLKTDLKEGASLKEFQKEQKHSSLAKMVHDLVLRRHGM